MSLGSAEGTEHSNLGPHCWAEKEPCPSLDPCWPQVQLGWVPGINPKWSWNCDGKEGLRWRVGPPCAQSGCGWSRAMFPPQGLGLWHSQHIPVVTFQSPSSLAPVGLLWGQSSDWSHPTQPGDPTVGFGYCQAPSPKRGKVPAARTQTPAPARPLRALSWLQEDFTAVEVKDHPCHTVVLTPDPDVPPQPVLKGHSREFGLQLVWSESGVRFLHMFAGFQMLIPVFFFPPYFLLVS